MPTTKLENQAKFNIKLLKQKNAQQVLKEGFFGACKTILDRKAMRWFLLTILPFVVLTIISSQIRSTSSTETIYVPQNFCELDKREECVEGKCIRYDPRKFRNSPSVMTYFPGGRMGNMITAYLTLLWMKLEFNYDVYLEKQSYLVSNNCFFLLHNFLNFQYCPKIQVPKKLWFFHFFTPISQMFWIPKNTNFKFFDRKIRKIGVFKCCVKSILG